ncbi:MAG: sugar ABC transporter permease, partial [Thermoanaerobacteraceae bacterium]|nr:sugar ABC transporter permease [Thermoanaerobacteraceae bacterium]
MKRLTNYFSESKNFIKDKFYDFRVSLHNTLSRGKKSKARTMQARKKSEIAFLVLLLAYPIGLFLLGYVYVNISSIVLAFQKYDTISGQYSWNSINNFKKVIYDLTQDPIISQVTIRSLVSYAVNLLIAFPLNIIFAFIIYKKIPFANFFQVILFLPSILSSLVIALMFKQFVDHVVPELLIKFGLQNPPNLLFDFRTAFAMQIFFVIWTGFGSQLILYSGAMSRIPNTLVEAGKLDGLTVFKEFWYITLPSIYQTIT